jgi:hypothetical protein
MAAFAEAAPGGEFRVISAIPADSTWFEIRP